jgi:hypothetical protein
MGDGGSNLPSFDDNGKRFSQVRSNKALSACPNVRFPPKPDMRVTLLRASDNPDSQDGYGAHGKHRENSGVETDWSLLSGKRPRSRRDAAGAKVVATASEQKHERKRAKPLNLVHYAFIRRPARRGDSVCFPPKADIDLNGS